MEYSISSLLKQEIIKMNDTFISLELYNVKVNAKDIIQCMRGDNQMILSIAYTVHALHFLAMDSQFKQACTQVELHHLHVLWNLRVNSMHDEPK